MLAPWFAPLAGVLAVGLLTLSGVRQSRALGFAAFAFSSIVMAACLIAVYLPIFQLSGNIR